jgi:hypothetical protein
MNKEFLLKILFGVVVSVLLFFAAGFFAAKPDKVVGCDSEIIYVQEYGWFNKDSVIVKYKQIKSYDGVIIDKMKTRRWVGSHIKHTRYVNIAYNDTTIRVRTNKFNYDNVTIGKHVKVTESWYPRHTISIF